MSQDIPARDKPRATTDDSIDFDERDARALTDCMTVLPEFGRAARRNSFYIVVGENGGGEYLVDLRTQTCECPDHVHRGVRCKHQRRVEFVTGERDLPAWVDRDAVDPELGQHVDATVRAAATDGGVLEADASVQDDSEDVVDLSEEYGEADARPEDCECEEWMDEGDLPCFWCWSEDFEDPNPAVLEDGDDQ